VELLKKIVQWKDGFEKDFVSLQNTSLFDKLLTENCSRKKCEINIFLTKPFWVFTRLPWHGTSPGCRCRRRSPYMDCSWQKQSRQSIRGRPSSFVFRMDTDDPMLELRASVNTVMNSPGEYFRFEFLDWLDDCQLLRKDSITWSWL
jgi:hypothetical protein